MSKTKGRNTTKAHTRTRRELNSVAKTNYTVRWIVIYPVDNIVIHLSKHPGLRRNNLCLARDSVTVRLYWSSPGRVPDHGASTEKLLNEKQLLLDKVIYDQ